MHEATRFVALPLHAYTQATAVKKLRQHAVRMAKWAAGFGMRPVNNIYLFKLTDAEKLKYCSIFIFLDEFFVKKTKRSAVLYSLLISSTEIGHEI